MTSNVPRRAGKGSGGRRMASYRRLITPARPRRVVMLVAIGMLLVAAAPLARRFMSSGPRGSPAAGTTSSPSRRPTIKATEPLGDRAELSGSVTDATSKAPIGGATLKIEQAQTTATVVSDGDGSYRALVDTSRPIALTVDAPGHRGTVAFAKLCAGERRALSFALPVAEPGSPPPSPMIVGDPCPAATTTTK